MTVRIPLQGMRVGDAAALDRDVAACPRCGVHRVVRTNRRKSLCSDCMYALSTSEQALWSGARTLTYEMR